MSLKDLAINDMADIMSDPDLGDSIDLKSPDGIAATIIARFVRHNQQFDFATGVPINGLNVSVQFSEKTLVAANANYPIRIKDKSTEEADRAFMNGHLVSFTDASGNKKQYQVLETMADETIGLIVLKLTPYSE